MWVASRVYCQALARALMRAILSLLFIVVTGQTGFAEQDDIPFGPIAVWERNPFYGFFYTPRAEPVTRVSSGSWALDAGAAFSNLFERQRSETYFQEFDFELTTLDLSIEHRPGKRWAWGALLRSQTLTGGFLDSFISDFHQSLGLPNDNREDVPNNDFSFRFGRPGERPSIDLPRQTAKIADPVFFFKMFLRKDVSAIQIAIKPPWGDRALSAGGVDIALEYLYQKRGPRHALHAKLGVVRLDVPPIFAEIMNKNAAYGSLSWEWRWKTKLAPILQLDGGSAYFRGTGLSNLDDVPLNLTLGVAGLVGETRWRLGFTEDILSRGPSVDFTLSLFLGWRF